MQNLEFSRKKWVWLGVLLAFFVLTTVSVVVLWVLLPDYFAIEGVEKKQITKSMTYIITAHFIVILALIAAILTLLFKNSTSKSSYFSTKKITYLAIFTAISYVFYMFIKFNLPIFPGFLDFQISDMPALLCGFMMGPLGGVLVIVLKVALKLPFSSTALVGELADLILGIAFVLPAALIYKYNRTKKGAVIGLICGSLTCVAASILINRYLLIPFYLNLGFFGGELKGLAASLSALYKNITVDNFYAYYLGLAVLPFNILRCLLSALVTFFVYKSCEKLFVKMFGNARTKKPIQQNQPKTID